jgi:hypothetical protein
MDAEIQGAIKYRKSEYQGVLQKDLPASVNEGNQCRIKVFEDLKTELLEKGEKPSGLIRHRAQRAETYSLAITTETCGRVQVHYQIPRMRHFGCLERRIIGKGRDSCTSAVIVQPQ